MTTYRSVLSAVLLFLVQYPALFRRDPIGNPPVYISILDLRDLGFVLSQTYNTDTHRHHPRPECSDLSDHPGGPQKDLLPSGPIVTLSPCPRDPRSPPSDFSPGPQGQTRIR